MKKHDELYIKELIREVVEDPRRVLIDEIITCIEELIDDTYEAALLEGELYGYEAGFDEGLDAGYADGKAYGYEDGYEEGHEAGLDEAKWGREDD